jgi:hypothetical protein
MPSPWSGAFGGPLRPYRKAERAEPCLEENLRVTDEYKTDKLLVEHIAQDLLVEWFNTCSFRGGWETATEQQRETFRLQARTAIKSARTFKAAKEPA